MVTRRPTGTAQPHRFVALDSLRGLAAVGVVLFHLPGLGPVGNSALARSGYLFVDFFFVLSGFVIAASYGDRLAQGFSRSRFAALRLGRVYPLHIVMVGAYLVAAVAIMRPAFADGRDLTDLFRAILLLDGYALTRTNYYNGQSWSISVELLLYAGAAILMGRGRLGIAIAGVLAVAAMASLLSGWQVPVWSTNVQRGICGFTLGAGTFVLFRKGFGARLPAGLAEGATVAIAIGFLIWAEQIGTLRWLVVFPFAALVLVFARDAGPLSRMLATRPMMALGRWSYSIYLTHPFLLGLTGHLALMAGFATGRGGADPILARLILPEGGQTAVLLGYLALVVGVSALTYALIEEPGRKWSKRWAARWGAPGAERVAPTI
ncbi:acyltransferase family protein [Croceicoccus naphthovorans]|uniref:acyltransferase family protein n=1 Tax=Croceicoccus naphthovorans TaxID=1348774 RepID=UPI000B05BDA3|nr:acyltransferase [Croceicoccus naphthovorans]MBB3989012.1 peptidoglycan/LPS O-acetylase OafA/YrhL [Croceicoccus naphthovorans]